MKWTVDLQSCHKCDVICENLPYGRTYIEGPDQMPRVMRGVWSGSTIFVTDEHLQRTFLSLLCSFNHEFYHKRVKSADLDGQCFSSIRQVFADDVTCTDVLLKPSCLTKWSWPWLLILFFYKKLDIGNTFWTKHGAFILDTCFSCRNAIPSIHKHLTLTSTFDLFVETFTGL